jgi:hypothetical protein
VPRLEEAKTETRFNRKLEDWAGKNYLEIINWKITPFGVRGLPDRIIMWPGRGIMFIEFKAPGQEPRKLQVFIHERLRRLGFIVETHDDEYAALESVKAKILATLASDALHVNDGERGWLPNISEAGAGQDGGGTESL